jgi:hypothetical protein
MTVKEYGERYGPRIFIETGTYLGDMVWAVKDNFFRIYSIELSRELYERARKRFSKYNHISVLEGDSSEMLPEILDSVEERCLFWLDGHYSAGITARGERETPILEELKHILAHSIEDHVILIDDARLFKGQGDYPTLEELREVISGRYPEHVLEDQDDIIRIHF